MYNERFKYALTEFEKFWERTNKKRPILNITVLGNAPYHRPPHSPEERWLDPQYKYDAYKYQLATRSFIAEGIPHNMTNFGPGCLAACIGGDFTLKPDTVWFENKQLVTDWENPPEIAFDEQSEMWQHILKQQKLISADPELTFSVPDLGGILDIVASLRGTQNLLYDLYDYPEEVKAFAQKVKEAWFKAFDIQIEALRKAGRPFNTTFHIPSSKPWYPIQCDFCAMISPAQFEEFVLPDIVDQVNYMDRSIYHLDGPGELPHIDMLLDIPKLNAIQWRPGSGHPHEQLWDEEWFGLYRKIQDKGKNLVLFGGISERDMAGAERLIKSIDPTGVLISVTCSSKEKGEEILEKVTRWCE